jgi:3-deoxy-7-phosphoheptulonate synthase
MIIVLQSGSTDEQIAEVEGKVRELGYVPHTIRGEVRTVVAAVGDEVTHSSLEPLSHLPMVDRVLPVQKKYKLISRETQPETAVVRVGGVEFGSGQFQVIAGPCSVEGEEMLIDTARAVRDAGATILRGGAFKPRTSPYSFQGLGQQGLAYLDKAKEVTGLPVVTELVSVADIDAVCRTADMIQIGARNALNYALLEAAADTGKPILLKRGMSATVEEWLLAAEYIAKRGNGNVILCERGIRTYETATRNTLDLGAVCVAKRESRLPVIVDPSHGAGRWDLIEPLSRAAAAIGADGIIVEVHPNPAVALSDGDQQIEFDTFARLMKELRPFVEAAGMELAGAGNVAAAT